MSERVTQRLMKYRLCVLLIAVGLTSRSSYADEDLTTETYFLDDIPVVLTANRLRHSLSDVPAAVTVIDKAIIKASGAKKIVELFRLVPGMQVGAKREVLTSVSYHGMSDEYARGMQVLVDGHSIYNAAFGGVVWVDYPLLIEDIERIEVIRGPAASSYGPNAFLGVINIITVHPAQEPNLETNFRAGGGDLYRGSIRYAGQWQDLAYRISYAHHQHDGFEGIHDGIDINTFSSRFDYQLSNQDSLQYSVGVSDSTHLVGINQDSSDPARKQRGVYFSQNFNWQHQLDETDQFSLLMTHNRHEITNRLVSNTVPINNDYFSEQLDLEFQHVFVPFQTTRLVWGAGTRFDRIKQPNWTGDDDYSNLLYRVFANVEQKFLDDFTLNIGALLEKILIPQSISHQKFLSTICGQSSITIELSWPEHRECLL